ncbi:uncharacterized protein EAE98_001383 [Botrytis deweyae]|uniref:Uncharacterized protein n=1 Tax=Botrytis deweyae TaxID=2478750 RepID=A0ABQ7J1M3_9HELO|nr:uncharacterized protein EAE98_001383 [Botrytis deweyae]KAF7939047.1 hypothetical protein EAE98_001383 [Botrytis deweyae]
MEDRTDAPKYLDAERPPLSPLSNLKAIDSSDNILSPISNILNNGNVQQTPLVSSCTFNTGSELSNTTENIINSAGEPSPPRLKKEFHPLEKNKNISSNPPPPPPPSLNFPPHNPNSTAPSPAELNSDSVSQTPSEHSSGSDAAFYCSVGSPSEDEEDGLSNSLDLRAEQEGEGESEITKRTLREAVSTSGTDGGGTRVDDEENDEENDEEEEEEENEIHKKNSKRRKSKKRFTFLKRIFRRKKARDSDEGAAGNS